MKTWKEMFTPHPRTALQLAVQQLEDAQHMKLNQSSLREYHSAMEDMLTHRISRLCIEISELSTLSELSTEGT